MIVNNNSTGEAIVITEHQQQEMRISADAAVQQHIIKVLTDSSYQRKVESIIREAVANSVDSNIEAGKDNAAVYVRLKKATGGKWYFETEDQGLGLDVAGFDKYIMGIGESTKRNNPKTFGYYGGGAKAPLSKVNSFDWICRKDGIERKFTIYKTNTLPKREVIYERPTTEPNGCIVHIDLPMSDHVSLWKAAMKEQLAYLPNVVFTVESDYGTSLEDWNSFTILQAPDFEMRQLTQNKPMHISLGGIYYPIDWGALELTEIKAPIALKFSLTDGLQPTFSREALQYDEFTRGLILGKIKKVTEWLVTKYNAEVKEYPTLLEGYYQIDNPIKTLTLNGIAIHLNPLLDLTGLKVDEPRVKGITTERLPFFKKEFDNFFCQYYVTAQTKTGRADWLKDKRFNHIEHFVLQGGQIIYLDEFPVGNFKTFLKQHYGPGVMYVCRKSDSKIPLFLNKELFSYSYYSLLNLGGKPKEEWRSWIQQWQAIRDSMTSKWIDASGLKDSRLYKEWLEEKRKEDRERRGYSGPRESNSIGKQKGDITYGVLRESMTRPKLTADRVAKPIAELHKIPALNVYFTEAELTEEMDLRVRRIRKAFTDTGHVRFVQLNVTELKYVKDLKNFKTFQEFMNSRPFARMATAILAARAMENSPENVKLLYEAFPKYKELRDKLKTYIRNNHSEYLSEDAEEDLLELAEKAGAWDPTIYPEIQQYEKVMKDFEFLKFMSVPEEFDEEEAKTLRSMVYVFLHTRKIQCTLLEDFQLVPRAMAMEMLHAAEAQLQDSEDTEEEDLDEELESDEDYDDYEDDDDYDDSDPDDLDLIA